MANDMNVESSGNGKVETVITASGTESKNDMNGLHLKYEKILVDHSIHVICEFCRLLSFSACFGRMFRTDVMIYFISLILVHQSLNKSNHSKFVIYS